MNTDNLSRWRTAIAALSVCIVTSSCVHRAASADLRKITTPPVMPQDVLARWDSQPFTLTQLVRISSQGTNYQLLFHIEWEQQTLTIVALSPVGLPIFRIQATATDTQVHNYISQPDKHTVMDPAWILSDFLLTVAPLTLLQESITDPDLHLVSNTPCERLLYRGKTPVIRILYSQKDPFASPLELTNLELEYHLNVDTLNVEN